MRKEREVEVGVESGLALLACEQHVLRSDLDPWLGSRLWLRFVPTSSGVQKSKTRSEVYLSRSLTSRRNTETRSARANLSHHGDGCRGAKTVVRPRR